MLKGITVSGSDTARASEGAYLLEVVLLSDDHLLTLATDVGIAVLRQLLCVADRVKPARVQRNVCMP
eukprot:1138781-Pelagomonas_calceolata.AAC.8